MRILSDRPYKLKSYVSYLKLRCFLLFILKKIGTCFACMFYYNKSNRTLERIKYATVKSVHYGKLTPCLTPPPINIINIINIIYSNYQKI